MNQIDYELAVSLRRELHQHPELSLQEDWTVKRLQQFLREHAPSLELHDRGHWFYAVYRAASPRASIAFRCDIDALPIFEDPQLMPHASQTANVSHKCGHDGHAATMAVFAVQVSRTGCDKDIYFLFQHAEEIGAGALECTAMLKENKIDAIYGYHNQPGLKLGAVQTMAGTFYDASKGMTISLTGKFSHASMPEVGINPAFAISDLIQALPDLTRKDEYTGLVQCTIIQIDVGAPNFGTQAHTGKLLLTIRGEQEEEMDLLQHKLEALARAKADEYGLGLSFSYCDYFPETANTPDQVDLIASLCQANGLEFHLCETPHRGSEDFGYYTQLIPGCIFEIGAGEDHPELHTAAFDFQDEIIPYALRLYWALVKA